MTEDQRLQKAIGIYKEVCAERDQLKKENEELKRALKELYGEFGMNETIKEKKND